MTSEYLLSESIFRLLGKSLILPIKKQTLNSFQSKYQNQLELGLLPENQQDAFFVTHEGFYLTWLCLSEEDISRPLLASYSLSMPSYSA